VSDLLTLVPTAMVAGGDALARDPDGRVVFVTGALPGEQVRAQITEARRDFARAVVVEVLDDSPDRVAPPCPALAAGCGGCTWQHVSAEAQVRLKGDLVVDALSRIARLTDPPVPRLVPQSEPALRTTARLAATSAGRAGHRRRGRSGQTAAVETNACLAAHPLLEELIVDGRYPGAAEVLLRVGVASGQRLVRPQGRAGDVVVPAGVAVVDPGDDGPGAGGAAAVHEDVGGRRLRISASSFFQSGPVAAAALADAVDAAAGDALPPGAHLVDAYAGVGLFASVLGQRHQARVTAVEHHPPALADARVNLGDLDANVVAAEVGRWRLAPGEATPDVVVADPSRSGLGRPGVAAVVAAGAPRIVLVSCDPASLARDTTLLGAAGYRLSSIALVDAFPHTFHTETVSRFDR
jgi:23S rRNA (uracil1939-C5)-methyltransferase